MIDYNIEEESKKIIEVYGENSIAGNFAKHILNLNVLPNYKYSFGTYSMPLKSNEIPPFTHKLYSNQIGNHTFGAEQYETPIKDWEINTCPHPIEDNLIVTYYWKKMD